MIKLLMSGTIVVWLQWPEDPSWRNYQYTLWVIMCSTDQGRGMLWSAGETQSQLVIWSKGNVRMKKVKELCVLESRPYFQSKCKCSINLWSIGGTEPLGLEPVDLSISLYTTYTKLQLLSSSTSNNSKMILTHWCILLTILLPLSTILNVRLLLVWIILYAWMSTFSSVKDVNTSFTVQY